jgi:hypothetical protein
MTFPVYAKLSFNVLGVYFTSLLLKGLKDQMAERLKVTNPINTLNFI